MELINVFIFFEFIVIPTHYRILLMFGVEGGGKRHINPRGTHNIMWRGEDTSHKPDGRKHVT